MYKNVCTGSVFVKNDLYTHVFTWHVSYWTFFKMYSSNSVYRKLALAPDKLNTCKSIKLAYVPMIMPLDMILPRVIKHTHVITNF